MTLPNPGAWLSDTTVQAWNALANAAANPPVVVAANPPVVVAADPPVGQSVVANPPVGARKSMFFVAADPPVGPDAWVRSGGVPFMPPIDPPRPRGAEPSYPWQGIDPRWVWGGEDALRAQALRKSRQRVAPVVDPRRAAAVTGKASVALAPRPADSLWRWDEPFRVRAAIAELLARLVVQDRTLYWMEPPAAKKRKRSQPLLVVPPTPVGFDYTEQIDKVARAAAEREDRLPEILVQAQDIGCFFDSVTGIDRRTAPHLRELLTACLETSSLLVMVMKNNIAEWRPAQRSARIAPVIDTPGHGSLPSGHAMQAKLSAELLGHLLYAAGDPRRDALERLARRIAFNRVVAGVHYPMDSFFGHQLGLALAGAIEALATGGEAPEVLEPTWTSSDIGLQLDERLSPTPTAAPAPTGQSTALQRPPSSSRVPDTLIARLWAAARAEVQQRMI